MQHPDGLIPFFNDAAFGIAPNQSLLFRRARELGVHFFDYSQTKVVHLEQSGYAKISNNNATLFADLADIGPQIQPGHAHADTLAFELSVNKSRILVNGGTSTYKHGPRRLLERSTRNHNCLQINGVDSSEVWAQFRVGRKAKAKCLLSEETTSGYRLMAEHNGYSHLPGNPKHCRSWTLQQDRLEIKDQISGYKKQSVQIFFLLAPNVFPKKESQSKVIAFQGGERALTFRFHSSASLNIKIEKYYWAFEFGNRKEAYKIICSGLVDLPSTIFTEICW